MKDPCLECLVRVTCWQECDEKRNYSALLNNALRNFKGTIMMNPTFQKQRRIYLNKSINHLLRQSKIASRASSMSKDK